MAKQAAPKKTTRAPATERRKRAELRVAFDLPVGMSIPDAILELRTAIELGVIIKTRREQKRGRWFYNTAENVKVEAI